MKTYAFRPAAAALAATELARFPVEAHATVVKPSYAEAHPSHAKGLTIADPRDGQSIAVAPTEVTVGEWRSWLATCTDALSLRELATRAVAEQSGGDDVAVRGLSFVQARAFARAAGAHLPTMREQWLAGSGGVEALTMPWGGKSEFARLAADPFHLGEAQAVRSLAAGQSPLCGFQDRKSTRLNSSHRT